MTLSENRYPLFRVMLCTKERKGSGTPTDAEPYPPQLSLRRALCKARSPMGVPPRLLPKRVFHLKGATRARLRDAQAKRGGAPRQSVRHFQRCTSRAGHGAGRLMPGLPGSGGDERPPAGTVPAFRQTGSPAGVLHDKRNKVSISYSETLCQQKS